MIPQSNKMERWGNCEYLSAAEKGYIFHLPEKCIAALKSLCLG